jgi:hypothetical protein
MLLVGYFEGIDSERGLEWRCADSLSLREFLRLGEREPVPDVDPLCGSTLAEPHPRPPAAGVARSGLHLGPAAPGRAWPDQGRADRRRRLDHGGQRALRAIVRRDTGEGYREMLVRMAEASGIETPTAEDLVRLDRRRKGKTLSNAEWESPADPDARIAKLKDGRTHLAHKPEHAVDLDTGAVVAAEMQPADRGDTATLPGTLDSAARHLAAVEAAPGAEAPAELVADKGYHSREVLKSLDGGPWKTRIAEPKRDGFLRWHGDDAARRAVVNNRTRLLSGVARAAFKLRAEVVERGFALILDRGGMRRAWLRGRENLHKRYLIHVAGYNLGLIMRLLTGAGTPREFQGKDLCLPCRLRHASWRPVHPPDRRGRRSDRSRRPQHRAKLPRLSDSFFNGLPKAVAARVAPHAAVFPARFGELDHTSLSRR